VPRLLGPGAPGAPATAGGPSDLGTAGAQGTAGALERPPGEVAARLLFLCTGNHPGYIHWSIPDPAASGGDDEATFAAVRETAARVEMRVAYLLAAVGAPSGRGSR